jgi:hypothetical protein
MVLGYFGILRESTRWFVDAFKQFPRFGIYFRMIFFQRQGIAPVFGHNILGYGLLTAHRVNGDDTAGNIQRLQQGRYRRDLIRFLFGLDFSQGQALTI